MTADRIKALEDALGKMLHAVCGETGFAACVRMDAGYAYPWPALDEAEKDARAALAASRAASDCHQPDLVAAARVPEIAALIEAAKKVHRSYWYSTDGIIKGMYEIGEALRAIGGDA